MFRRLSFHLHTLPNDLNFGCGYLPTNSVYLRRLCICDSLWRKIKPPPWNNFREEGKGRDPSSQRTNQGVQCPTWIPGKVSSPFIVGFLLHENAHLVGQCKCCRLSQPTERLWRGGAPFLLTNTQLWFAHKLPMTHPATGCFLCLKGQWGWEKPTGQQAGKEGKISPHSTRWLSWKVTHSKCPLLQKQPFEELKGIWKVSYSPKSKSENVPKGWLKRTSMEKTGFYFLGFSQTLPTNSM